MFYFHSELFTSSIVYCHHGYSVCCTGLMITHYIVCYPLCYPVGLYIVCRPHCRPPPPLLQTPPSSPSSLGSRKSSMCSISSANSSSSGSMQMHHSPAHHFRHKGATQVRSSYRHGCCTINQRPPCPLPAKLLLGWQSC